MSTTVKNFLCCFKLRTGAYVIGTLYTLGSLLIVTLCGLAIASGMDYFQLILNSVEDTQVKEAMVEQKWAIITTTGLYSLALAVSLLTTPLLLFAVFTVRLKCINDIITDNELNFLLQNCPKLFVPFLCVDFVEIVFNFLMTFVQFEIDLGSFLFLCFYSGIHSSFL